MESIEDILKNRNVTGSKKNNPVQPWQDLAAQIYEELRGVDTEKASIFMLCKADYAKAFAAFKECKARDKNILYWFKIMNSRK